MISEWRAFWRLLALELRKPLKAVFWQQSNIFRNATWRCSVKRSREHACGARACREPTSKRSFDPDRALRDDTKARFSIRGEAANLVERRGPRASEADPVTGEPCNANTSYYVDAHVHSSCLGY